MNISSDMRDIERDLEEKEIQSNIIKMIEFWSYNFEAPVLDNKGFPSKKREELAFSLIEEELQELKEAQEKRDITAIQDALGDILWVTVRAMMEYGIDPLSTIQAIYKSNMSKMDSSFEDVLKSAMMYHNKGIETYYKTTPNGKYLIKRMSDDKILKSHKFVEPKF